MRKGQIFSMVKLIWKPCDFTCAVHSLWYIYVISSLISDEVISLAFSSESMDDMGSFIQHLHSLCFRLLFQPFTEGEQILNEMIAHGWFDTELSVLPIISQFIIICFWKGNCNFADLRTTTTSDLNCFIITYKLLFYRNKTRQKTAKISFSKR